MAGERRSDSANLGACALGGRSTSSKAPRLALSLAVGNCAVIGAVGKNNMKPLPLLPTLPSNLQSSPIAYLAEQLDWFERNRERAVRLWEQGYPPLVTTNTLPFILGVSPSLFLHFANNKGVHYKTFDIPKRHGRRVIDAPRVALKVVQTYIAQHIADRFAVHDAAHAFRANRNKFSNGAPHAGAPNFMSLDIRDFFPSTTEQAILRLFAQAGFPGAIAGQLADLCTKGGGLPQGAPSSPSLSNAVFLEADVKIQDLATQWSASYTRYADDLSFSSSVRRFGPDDVAAIQAILSEHGYELNTQKTMLVGGGFRHEAAGVSVSSAEVIAPRWRRRKWRGLFHKASESPRNFAGRSQELRGIAAFVHQYDAALASRYFEVAAQVRSYEANADAR